MFIEINLRQTDMRFDLDLGELRSGTKTKHEIEIRNMALFEFSVNKCVITGDDGILSVFSYPDSLKARESGKIVITANIPPDIEKPLVAVINIGGDYIIK